MLQQDVQDFLDVSRLTPTKMTYDVDNFFTIKDDVLLDTVVRISNVMEYTRANMRLEPNTGSENPFNWIATVPLPLKQHPTIDIRINGELTTHDTNNAFFETFSPPI